MHGIHHVVDCWFAVRQGQRALMSLVPFQTAGAKEGRDSGAEEVNAEEVSALCACRWWAWQGVGREILDTANLRTKILDFRGFDLSRIVILRCEILISIVHFLESLSQVLVAIILVGRLGVVESARRRRRSTRRWRIWSTRSTSTCFRSWRPKTMCYMCSNS